MKILRVGQVWDTDVSGEKTFTITNVHPLRGKWEDSDVEMSNVAINSLTRLIKDAGRCTDCGVYSDTVWANTNYEYRRNLDDFVELCVKCHHEKDRNSGRWGDATRQFNLGVPGKSGRREST